MKVFSIEEGAPTAALIDVSGVVSTCWKQAALGGGGYRWMVALTADSLLFRTQVAVGVPEFDGTHRRGDFVEGLAERDVVELFIMDESGCYQEFHVSPAGAWWSCYFTGYRQRSDIALDGRPSSVSAQQEAGGWSAEIVYPRAALRVLVNEKSLVHVTAIASISGERRFLSSAPVSGIAPDFHRRECFQPIELVSLQGAPK